MQDGHEYSAEAEAGIPRFQHEGWDPEIGRILVGAGLEPTAFQKVFELCREASAVIEAPRANAAGTTTFDTRSNHLFDSWKDADLYRAIDLPENGEPGPAQEREIEEYVEELKRRHALRAAEAARRAELDRKYGIGDVDLSLSEPAGPRPRISFERQELGRLPGETYGR